MKLAIVAVMEPKMRTIKGRKTNRYLIIALFIVHCLPFFFGSHLAWAGPNLDAGCALDTDYTTQDYDAGITSKGIDSTINANANDEIWIAVVAQNVTNLDTYQVEVNFDPSRMSFIQGFEDNPFDGVNNLLKKNGGITVGFQAVENVAGIVNVANALSGTDTNKAPEGSGIIALLKFKVLDGDPDNHLTLSNVHYLNSGGTDNSITNLMYAVVNPDDDIHLLGDIDDSRTIDLRDALLALQLWSGQTPTQTVHLSADVNDDGRIGVEEVIYILQSVAGMRLPAGSGDGAGGGS